MCIFRVVFYLYNTVRAEWWWVATLPLYIVDERKYYLFFCETKNEGGAALAVGGTIVATLLQRVVYTGQPTTTPIKLVLKSNN